MTVHLGFHGAAGTVTGSKFHFRAGRDNVLVDCGLFQGLKQLRLRNWDDPPFEPSALDAVLITHGHLDHSGYLPILARRGFHGPVYCTPATAELLEILLLDAAHINEEDAEYANRKGFSKHRPALPLFDEADARRALRLIKPVDFDEPLDIGGIQATFQPAGHILGSAFIVLHYTGDDGQPASIAFSGDLGRVDMPLHINPAPLPPVDAVALESTYGDRQHPEEPPGHDIEELFRPVLERGGTVLVPSFAVARAQLVTVVLRDLITSGRLPEVPIHIDSPMALDVLDSYNRYLGGEDLDEDIPGASARSLFPRNVHFHRTSDDSKALNDLSGPRIIISASGMLTGGRILHHLKRLAPDPGNLICLVGYQAAGTRGRKLYDGATYIRIHGRDVPVRAKVSSIEGFSAHADSDGLYRWATSNGVPPDIFLVHGEPEATAAMAQRFRGSGARIHRPDIGDEYIGDGGWKPA